MDPIKRSDLHEHTKAFGLDYGKAGIDAALRAVGVKPAKFVGQAGGRGRIAYYSPFVLWLLVAVWESQKRRFGDMRNALDDFRELYDELVSEDGAASFPEEVREDREAGAQLLMLTSPVFGLEPRDIRRITFSHPETLEYSEYGRDYVVRALQAYNNVIGRTVASLSVDPKEGRLPSHKQQIRQVAHNVLREMNSLRGMDEYNKSDAARAGDA